MTARIPPGSRVGTMDGHTAFIYPGPGSSITGVIRMGFSPETENYRMARWDENGRHEFPPYNINWRTF